MIAWLKKLLGLPPYFCEVCGTQEKIWAHNNGMSPFDGVNDPMYACPNCKPELLEPK